MTTSEQKAVRISKTETSDWLSGFGRLKKKEPGHYSGLI